MDQQHPPPPPQPLEYAPVPPAKKNHDQIFMGLLIALAFLLMLVIGQFIIMGRTGVLPTDSFVFKYIVYLHSLYLASIILALLVRWFVPTMKRTITISVSIILLLFFPFGTIVGVYGLTRVDRIPQP